MTSSLTAVYLTPGQVDRLMLAIEKIEALENETTGIVTIIKEAIERLEYLASCTRGFLSKDGLVASEGTADSIDHAARELRERAARWLVGDLEPETSQGERR